MQSSEAVVPRSEPDRTAAPAAMAAPGSPIIMLTRTLDEIRDEWANDLYASEALSRYVGLDEAGTRIWVYGQECFAATVVGLSLDLVESMFAPTDCPIRHFAEPLIAATRDDTGELFQVGAGVTATLEAAQKGWHILDSEGLIVAGGPNITQARAQEIANRRGPGFTIRRGVPVDGVDRRPDDGLGIFEPEQVALPTHNTSN
ncbi:hypothetical protein ACFV9C_42450 [Kribbella sp. NPDC059898]|uniref:hypothetical protein n=1 Tax=Kribbella sp. NPDC059898 TaxID=3346995 RepID=UPI00365E1676